MAFAADPTPSLLPGTKCMDLSAVAITTKPAKGEQSVSRDALLAGTSSCSEDESPPVRRIDCHDTSLVYWFRLWIALQ